ncbi:DciA family protein [Embleya sp. NPDC008237]|uniref:DciA family protein n=1 Tax=Embleya sp. NPDC008237 TaxID=3363978 RepID=UPI0036F14990
MTDTHPAQPAEQWVGANDPAADNGAPPRDLARQALRETLAALRRAPQDSRVASRVTGRRPLGSAGADGRDPRPVAAVLQDLMVTHAWEAPTAAGGIVDAWPRIAPELADHVTVEHYDPSTRCLELRPDSPTYATQLRLLGDTAMCRRVNAAVGRDVVRTVRVLATGTPRTRPAARPPASPRGDSPTPREPRKTPVLRADPDRPQPVGHGRPGDPWARAAARARRERDAERPCATPEADTGRHE